MTPNEFRSTSPRDLAMMFRGERWRWNRELIKWSWIISWLVSPHVRKQDQSKTEARRVVMSAPGYDPDEEDLIGSQ